MFYDTKGARFIELYTFAQYPYMHTPNIIIRWFTIFSPYSCNTHWDFDNTLIWWSVSIWIELAHSIFSDYSSSVVLVFPLDMGDHHGWPFRKLLCCIIRTVCVHVCMRVCVYRYIWFLFVTNTWYSLLLCQRWNSFDTKSVCRLSSIRIKVCSHFHIRIN